jgi:RNA polymerase sigma-70 factor (ECF subfamily)
MMEVPADQALVRATLRGDEQAFALLVRRHLRAAMAVALEYTRTREDAEDVVQDTFRRAYENLGRFDLNREFAPWFFTILRNTARNALASRRRREHEALADEHAAGTPDPLEDASRAELRRCIQQAVEQLPRMQQSCFRLCQIEGLSTAEAAVSLGLAEGTVRVHVFRARGALQHLLAAWRDEDERP